MDNIQHHFSNKNGFTLVELIITLAIVAVLASLGVPSFVQSIRSNRLTTNINELTTSLSFARSEAIKRGQPVTVRKSGAEWENGWTIFTDLDGDGVEEDNGADDDDVELRIYNALPAGFTLRGTFTNRITFQATGISSNGSFVLCENSDGNNTPESDTSKLVVVNVVGRVSMGDDSDDDGIPEKNDGSEITSCTVSPFT